MGKRVKKRKKEGAKKGRVLSFALRLVRHILGASRVIPAA